MLLGWWDGDTSQPAAAIAHLTSYKNSYDSLVGLHFNVVAGYEAFLSVQLGPVPVHVVLHVQDLRTGADEDWLTKDFTEMAFLSLKSTACTREVTRFGMGKRTRGISGIPIKGGTDFGI